MTVASSREVYQNLKTALVCGTYVQGSRLRAERLRKEYNCSASTLREVFFRLSIEGYLQASPQRGFSVPITSLQLRMELIRLRILLELEGARLSIERGDLEWEARLTAAHHKLSHIENRIRTANFISPYRADWNQAEFDFHHALIAACGNDMLMEYHEKVFFRFRMQLMSDDVAFGYRIVNIGEHRTIMEYALARETENCCRMLETHINKNLSGQSKILMSEKSAQSEQ